MTSTAPTSDPASTTASATASTTASTTAPAPGPGLGRVAALLVLSAPIGLLLSELIAPRETSDLSEAQDLAFLLDNSARLTASWLLGLVVAGLLATAADGRLPTGSVVVCTVTGHGLKDPDTALSGMVEVEPLPVDPGAVATALELA